MGSGLKAAGLKAGFVAVCGEGSSQILSQLGGGWVSWCPRSHSLWCGSWHCGGLHLAPPSPHCPSSLLVLAAKSQNTAETPVARGRKGRQVKKRLLVEERDSGGL